MVITPVYPSISVSLSKTQILFFLKIAMNPQFSRSIVHSSRPNSLISPNPINKWRFPIHIIILDGRDGEASARLLAGARDQGPSPEKRSPPFLAAATADSAASSSSTRLPAIQEMVPVVGPNHTCGEYCPLCIFFVPK